METFISDLSGKEFPASERVSGQTVRPSLMALINLDKPDFGSAQYLAISELNTYREKYISNYLVRQLGELTDLEKNVLESIADKTIITDLVDEDDDKQISLGQRVADKVATFGGSWTFIISFGGFLLFWIGINAFWLLNKGFDPYPFILLNLILSCLAALQAPVIMMSQNRQEEKDRERAKKDYMINLKSELEIRTLHVKMDHLIIHQQRELMEIQKIQVEMMNDILSRLDTKN